MSDGLKFAPWTSDIELAFYSSLANLKIHHDKLDSSSRKVRGLYCVDHRDVPERSARMQFHGSALTSDSVPNGHCRGEGSIRNYNTIEEYRQVDKTAHIVRAGSIIFDAISDGSIYSCPSLLASFTAICFADLKKYKFTYHVAYPALHSVPPWRVAENRTDNGPQQLTKAETVALVDKVQTWKYGVDARQHGFFLAKKTTQHSIPDVKNDTEGAETPLWTIASLSAYEDGFFHGAPAENRFVCFVDPSTYPENPGWMLRNLLVLVQRRYKLDKVQVLCYRDTHVRREQPTSRIMQLECTGSQGGAQGSRPKITGWERNAHNKAIQATVDLAAYLDPARLADQAVDLNLRLIKWRIAPTIDLDVIKNSSYLLLGAGTLGSYVARNLMGWGARHITLVDNGRVSYSNPVRQPLFKFKDCQNGGAPKAETAAEALREIYPGVNAKGICMSVPMAGHIITDDGKVKGDFEALRDLIDAHDAIFLLMDTRESRWLPTVMAKAAGKIVINAALGFDSYMVMRHGVRLDSDAKKSAQSGEELGCYFCTDVVVPADSLKSTTLDQQCTVTRPGVAPIASALAVELLVSILQSPQRARVTAPEMGPRGGAHGAAPAISTPAASAHPLGTVPHQLRGFMSNWQTMIIKGPAYDCCSACSSPILNAYTRDGWDFVKRAIIEKGYVEEISGLAEVQRRAEELDKDIDWDDEDAIEL